MYAAVICFMQRKTTAAACTSNPVGHFVTAGCRDVNIVIVIAHPVVIVNPAHIQATAHIRSRLGLYPIHTAIGFGFYGDR